MRPRLKPVYLLMLLVLCAWALPAWATETRPLEIGLVPNLTARTLLTAFEPMRAYLELELRQPVRLSTAPNFREFYARTQQGEFDVVVTPAHFAWLAQHEAGYIPLLTYTQQLSGLLIVERNSPIQSVADLRGKRIGIVDPLAIVSMRGLRVLQEQGLRPGADFSVHAIAPHNAAAVAVVQGDLDAAIIGSGPYRIMAEETRARLRVLRELGAVPNAIYLAHKRLPPARRRALQALLQAFAENTPAGQSFMAQYHYGGFKTISADDLKSMDIYAEQVKLLLYEE
jgi:phosphonate transport system substrate-binding protein